VTEAAAAALLRLPVHTAMTNDDAERVVDAVLRFFATAC
jgi:dTDP-4-amino-4,6-dideoxygalactose transaminase